MTGYWKTNRKIVLTFSWQCMQHTSQRAQHCTSVQSKQVQLQRTCTMLQPSSADFGLSTLDLSLRPIQSWRPLSPRYWKNRGGGSRSHIVVKRLLWSCIKKSQPYRQLHLMIVVLMRLWPTGHCAIYMPVVEESNGLKQAAASATCRLSSATAFSTPMPSPLQTCYVLLTRPRPCQSQQL